MKIIYYLLIAIILCFFFSAVGNVNHTNAEKNDFPVEEIMEQLRNEHIAIDEWTIMAKFSFKQKHENPKQLRSQFRQFKWLYVHNGSFAKWDGTYRNQQKKIVEKFQIITPTDEPSKTIVIYQATGRFRPENWKTINLYFDREIFDKIPGNPLFFTCIKGHTSGIMKGVLRLKTKKLLEQFEAKPVEELNEETFVSVSGLTKKWNHSIPTQNGNMNIQVALRSESLGENTIVTVGTPIITTEY